MTKTDITASSLYWYATTGRKCPSNRRLVVKLSGRGYSMLGYAVAVDKSTLVTCGLVHLGYGGYRDKTIQANLMRYLMRVSRLGR